MQGEGHDEGLGEGQATSASNIWGSEPTSGPLAGVRVIDMATIIAGPGAARHMADFGASVVKVEPPAGDASRRLGWQPPTDDTDSYYWKIVGRNKTLHPLDLKTESGLDSLFELIDEAHLLVENNRPGKLEALGLAPEVLWERRPELVILRVTAFGQRGPYSARPGFATLAEAMSGYAAISGSADGGPMLPPVALTDEVTAMAAAYSAMTALWHARETGEGQVVEVNLLEVINQVLGPLVSASAHLNYEQPRLDGGIPYSVPRGCYRCADDRWIALSNSSDRAAARTLAVMGLEGDARFVSFDDRIANRDELEALTSEWCRTRTSADALAALQAGDAAAGPVYSVAELRNDPHALETDMFIEVDGVVQPRPLARLSKTPPEVRHIGKPSVKR